MRESNAVLQMCRVCQLDVRIHRRMSGDTAIDCNQSPPFSANCRTIGERSDILSARRHLMSECHG
jgi:hypothetical protein